jgi:hypothetical protein
MTATKWQPIDYSDAIAARTARRTGVGARVRIGLTNYTVTGQTYGTTHLRAVGSEETAELDALNGRIKR